MDFGKIKVVSWDVDGTLYDSALMQKFLVKNWCKSLWRRSTWRDIQVIVSAQRMVANVRAAGGDMTSLFNPQLRMNAEALERRWFEEAIIESGLRLGVIDTMNAIAERGVLQIAVSDFHSDYKLHALGVDKKICSVFACEDYGAFKPSAVIFSVVCRELNICPEELLHIGDRIDTDGVAAQKAGCHYRIITKGQALTMKWLLQDR